MRYRGTTWFLLGCACVFALGAARWSAPPAEKAARVTLVKRSDNDAYGKSAYSFRYASQDARDHKNAVDLIFNGCGNLHIAEGGGTNRIVKTSVTKLSRVEEIPEAGWSSKCFSPEKGAVYVMQIEDSLQRFTIKLRVVDAKKDKVVIEWLPLRVLPAQERGTLGQCGGPHDCQ